MLRRVPETFASRLGVLASEVEAALDDPDLFDFRRAVAVMQACVERLAKSLPENPTAGEILRVMGASRELAQTIAKCEAANLARANAVNAKELGEFWADVFRAIREEVSSDAAQRIQSRLDRTLLRSG